MASVPGVDTLSCDTLAVTPSATTTYNPPLRGLYVGANGSVTITNPAGASITFAGVLAGTILPCAATQVTSAAGGSIVGLR